jgi:GntR family transcriptional regulator
MKTLLVQNNSLTDQVENILIGRIKDGFYPAGGKLPSEVDLALELNVSKATIRSALAVLTSNGYIVRRHGIGTFVNQRALLSNPLDLSHDFLSLISENGYKADFSEVCSRLIVPDDKVTQKLELKESQQVFEVHKIFTADGEPVIYSHNYIPGWLYEDVLSEEEILAPKSTEPFFHFFRDICGHEMDYYLSDVRVGLTTEYPSIADLMGVEDCMPMLVIDEVGYSAEGLPLNYATEYFFGNTVIFSLRRKCLEE